MMAAASAEDLLSAARILEIGDDASLREIRQRYHDLLKEWHPDTSGKDPDESHGKTILLTRAYTLLREYCMNYQFSFREEDLNQKAGVYPVSRWMERYGDDPIWN